MGDTAQLERAYRRLVAFYPRSFRRENEEEILTVLLATAREGQRHPSVVESADLVKGAVRMRMGMSRTPRTVLRAVRLMYLGAIAELGVLVAVVLTEGSIRTAIVDRNPLVTVTQLQSLNTVFTVDIVGASLAAALWLWMAWANGKGIAFARGAAVALFAICTLGYIADLATGAPLYAPVAVAAAGVVWLIGLASIVMLLQKQSAPHFARPAAN